LWILLVLIVAAAAGVAAYLVVSDNGSSGNANRHNVASLPSAAKAQFATTSFDPRPGDGSEDPDAVGNVSDGNPSTVWSTDQYNQFPDGPKEGVGLALDLNSEHDLKKVLVDTQQIGWGASIYVSDRPAGELATLSDWGNAVAQGSDFDRSNTFETGGVKARSVLLWFTQLPEGDNGKHYVSVSEVRLA